MEPFIALTHYDIFAYLMVGIASLAAWDLIFGTHFVFRREWGAGVTTMVVILAYLVGQIVSWPAESVFENYVIAEWLKAPSEHLVPPLVPSNKPSPAPAFIPDPPTCYFNRYVSPYCTALPAAVQDRVRQKALHSSQSSSKIDYIALYAEAFAATKKDVNAFDRVSVFSRLYVFCRNMSFAALLAAALAFSKWVLTTQDLLRWRGYRIQIRPYVNYGIQAWLNKPYWQLLLFLVVGIGMFFRFIFFYRLHAVEVLTTYAFVPLPILE